MEKILVTGAGGLVGYDVAKVLQEQKNCKVFTTFHRQSLYGWRNALQLNLENTSIENLEINFDYVVHCAAMIPNNRYSDTQVSSVNRCIDDNIIHYCSQHKSRLIFISSIAVYENDNKSFLSEQTRLNLNSGYKLEKRNSEIKIEKECASYCILRISSPYGPRQKNVTVFKRFIDATHKGENIYYFGTGNRTQDFINVKDIAYAVQKCMAYRENQIFNIASGQPISMKQLAEQIIKAGKKEFSTSSEMSAGDRRDPQEENRVNIDIKKARNLLGWEPQVRLEDGIQDWMKNIKEESEE